MKTIWARSPSIAARTPLLESRHRRATVIAQVPDITSRLMVARRIECGTSSPAESSGVDDCLKQQIDIGRIEAGDRDVEV